MKSITKPLTREELDTGNQEAAARNLSDLLRWKEQPEGGPFAPANEVAVPGARNGRRYFVYPQGGGFTAVTDRRNIQVGWYTTRRGAVKGCINRERWIQKREDAGLSLDNFYCVY